MQRHALAPLGPTREQILIAIPHRATSWSIAQRNRGQHRLLLPVDASLHALNAVRYIVAELAYHVAGVHIVNVQSGIMSGDITPLVSVKTITALREATGQRILAVAREAFAGSAIPVTSEVSFGAPAETICRLARERNCTGIVIGRDGCELYDLIRGSVAAKVLRLATVPVTIVNAPTAARVAHRTPKRSWMERNDAVVRASSLQTVDSAAPRNKQSDSLANEPG